MVLSVRDPSSGPALFRADAGASNSKQPVTKAIFRYPLRPLVLLPRCLLLSLSPASASRTYVTAPPCECRSGHAPATSPPPQCYLRPRIPGGSPQKKTTGRLSSRTPVEPLPGRRGTSTSISRRSRDGTATSHSSPRCTQQAHPQTRGCAAPSPGS